MSVTTAPKSSASEFEYPGEPTSFLATKENSFDEEHHRYLRKSWRFSAVDKEPALIRRFSVVHIAVIEKVYLQINFVTSNKTAVENYFQHKVHVPLSLVPSKHQEKNGYSVAIDEDAEKIYWVVKEIFESNKFNGVSRTLINELLSFLERLKEPEQKSDVATPSPHKHVTEIIDSESLAFASPILPYALFEKHQTDLVLAQKSPPAVPAPVQQVATVGCGGICVIL